MPPGNTREADLRLISERVNINKIYDDWDNREAPQLAAVHWSRLDGIKDKLQVFGLILFNIFGRKQSQPADFLNKLLLGCHRDAV